MFTTKATTFVTTHPTARALMARAAPHMDRLATGATIAAYAGSGPGVLIGLISQIRFG